MFLNHLPSPPTSHIANLCPLPFPQKKPPHLSLSVCLLLLCHSGFVPRILNLQILRTFLEEIRLQFPHWLPCHKAVTPRKLRSLSRHHKILMSTSSIPPPHSASRLLTMSRFILTTSVSAPKLGSGIMGGTTAWP